MKDDRARGPMAYHLHVVGTDAVDVVRHAAGLILDRVMSGWRVTVALQNADDVAALRVLGGEIVEFGGQLTEFDDECFVLAVAAEHRPVDAAGDMLVWGEHPGPPIVHRLSAASRAFKAQAFAAVGLSQDGVDDEQFSAAAPQYQACDAR